MNRRTDGHTKLWIPGRDSLGNSIDRRLIDAAHRVWERARLVVLRYLAEDTEAAEVLEGAVDAASRAMSKGQSITFFDRYLLRSVARESIRRLKQRHRIEYIDSADLDRIAISASSDVDQQLDDARRIEIFRACLDQQGRTIYDLRVLDFDWRSIAKLAGYADSHSAEVQFRKKIKRALKRFMASQDSRLKPQSTTKGTLHHMDSDD